MLDHRGISPRPNQCVIIERSQHSGIIWPRHLRAFLNLRSYTENITDLELKSEFSDATWVYLANPLYDLLHNTASTSQCTIIKNIHLRVQLGLICLCKITQLRDWRISR